MAKLKSIPKLPKTIKINKVKDLLPELKDITAENIYGRSDKLLVWVKQQYNNIPNNLPFEARYGYYYPEVYKNFGGWRIEGMTGKVEVIAWAAIPFEIKH